MPSNRRKVGLKLYGYSVILDTLPVGGLLGEHVQELRNTLQLLSLCLLMAGLCEKSPWCLLCSTGAEEDFLFPVHTPPMTLVVAYSGIYVSQVVS